jgi:hypothetical protein
MSKRLHPHDSVAALEALLDEHPCYVGNDCEPLALDKGVINHVSHYAPGMELLVAFRLSPMSGRARACFTVQSGRG